MGDPRSHSNLFQCPQPTRPICSFEPQISEQARDPKEFRHPEVLELPKPSSHGEKTIGHQVQFYDLEPPPSYYPQFSQPLHNRSSSWESSFSFSEERIHFSPSTGKTPKGEKEAVDELLLILVECMEELNTRSRESLLRKFFSVIERDERLEKFIVERLGQSKVKAIAELCEKLPANARGQFNSGAAGGDDNSMMINTTRSLHESVEELSLKLERFKVRTLDLGVVVKEDEEKKS